MTDTIYDTKLAYGRMEVRTGVGRRRCWTAQGKGRIGAETLNAVVPVAEIARRHDMSSQHLFNWIRAAKEGRLVLPAEEGAAFVPVLARARVVREMVGEDPFSGTIFRRNYIAAGPTPTGPSGNTTFSQNFSRSEHGAFKW